MKIPKRACWIYVLFLWSALPLLSQNYGWVRIAQVSDQFNSPSAVEFLDSLHGWAGGSAINRTNDGGYTWTSFGVDYVPSSISMFDTLNGWSVGWDGSVGKISRTTNGGLSWTQQREKLYENYRGTSTRSASKNTTAGGTTNFSPDTGKILQTADGGVTWTERTMSDSIYLFKMQFTDSLHGWIIATINNQGGILRTTNGGTTWEVFPAPRLFRSISFIDSTHGWGMSHGGTSAFYTNDGGSSWEQRGAISDPYWDNDPNLYALSFVDSVNGWAFGLMFFEGDLSAVVFHTADGGWTWSREFVTHEARALADGQMLDKRHGWAVGGGLVFSYKLITHVAERLAEQPHSFSLRQNFPNPFNGQTTIEYELKQASYVTLTLFDVAGRQLEQILNTRQDAGVYRIRFDGSLLPSGVYYYTIKAGAFSDTKSMTVMK